MTKDDDTPTNTQLDLGLTQILESLSGEHVPLDIPQEAVSFEDSSSVQEDQAFDPKVIAVAEALTTKSIPVVLLVPQVLELFYGTPDLSSASKKKAVETSVTVIKELLGQDEPLLAESVLAAIKTQTLTQGLVQELVHAVKGYLDSNKDTSSGFSSEDPKLLNARLQLLDHLRRLETLLPRSTPAEPIVEKSVYEFSPAVDRSKTAVGRKQHLSLWSWLIIAGAIAVTLYSFYLNKNSLEYEIADSSFYTGAKAGDSFGSLIAEPSIQRQEVSDLSALAYDVSRDPPTPAASIAPSEPPAAIGNQAVQSPVASANRQKVALDMSGPVEPVRVKELFDKRENSIYERPVERIERRPQLDEQRPRLPERRPRDTDRPGRFETGQRYEVMINTSVMEAPSFNAREVEELYVGDRVRVEARLGRWLKIRSRDGNPGYILAGDAEKLFD